MAIDTEELIDALENEGWDVSSYSGHGMFGKECVSVRMDGASNLWDLAIALGHAGLDIPAPRTDSLGLGIVVYWPSAKWNEGQSS